MEENLQNMTLLSQIEQDIIVEYSFIPTPILESFYKIRQYCGLMLSEIDSVSKQLSDILYAQSCTKALFSSVFTYYVHEQQGFCLCRKSVAIWKLLANVFYLPASCSSNRVY